MRSQAHKLGEIMDDALDGYAEEMGKMAVTFYKTLLRGGMLPEHAGNATTAFVKTSIDGANALNSMNSLTKRL